jgi:transaldolase
MSALHDLTEAGQSIWIDNITRDLLDDGTIASYIENLSVTGLTSNPSIFDKAVRGSSAYDAQVATLAAEGLSAEEIFFQLAIDDLRRAADLFAPVHAATGGVDGWVSLEVSPLLADDTERTVEAAITLAAQAGRDNLFIKIPGTPAGLPAIEAAITAGVPVNVTLLFSTEQYLAAADAYLRGLEQRLATGQDLGVHSVASLFISRWDVAANPNLPATLQNTLGLAIGAESYAAFRSLLASDRVTRLIAAGAPIQRLLFASTGTKDPAAPDTLYVDGLVAPDTVNTMPDATLHAFADHGGVPGIVPNDGVEAEKVLASITAAGVDIPALATRLQEEGKDSFVAAWEELIAAVETKGAR